MSGPSYILDKLYLGSVDDACDSHQLQQHGITHILTVDCKPLPLETQEGFQYKYVYALDMESHDLLSDFNQSLQFIEEGRQNGGILVHCLAGQSRSATLVLAYIMQKLDMSLDDAETLVMKHRPKIRPNHGFRDQLELFESMGNQVSPTNEEYKMYRLGHLATKLQLGQFTEGLPEGMMSADPSLAPNTGHTLYKCRKCRRSLFRHTAILPHTEGRGELDFGWRRRLPSESETDVQGKQCAQSLFIEPVQWMEGHIVQLEGKLTCPKCQAKIGSFKWSGEQCPCGTWLTPAFHIQPGKVDKCLPRAVPSPATAGTNLQQTGTNSQRDGCSASGDSGANKDKDVDSERTASVSLPPSSSSAAAEIPRLL